MAKKRKGNRPRPKAAAAPAQPEPASPGAGAIDPEDLDDAVEPAPLPKSKLGKTGKSAGGVRWKPSGERLPARRDADADRQPAFWFGFEISWAKLATARVVVFALLAIDALLQISHAPRYGAGGFNVAQLPLLDAIAPGRVAYEAGQLLAAYLFVLAACNIATRIVVPAAAVIYAWLYFSSHLDSYQHHYLVALLLGIASFVPWSRPRGDDAAPATPVRSWAVRLMLVQLGIMYLWAAISKMHPAWVDGRALSTQVTGVVRSMIEGTVGFSVASVAVIAVELVLAVTVWLRPAWRFAAPLGIAFHAMILLSGLEIGLFAVLMLGLYILVVPDRVWIAAARVERGAASAVRRLAERPMPLAWIGGLVVAILVGVLSRFEHGLAVALFACAIPVTLGVLAWRRGAPVVAGIPLAHAAALVLWLLVDRASSVAFDYYRLWGGSQLRLGGYAEAEYAYRKVIDLAPDDGTGHLGLGRALLASKRAEEGVTELQIAQRLEPDRARARVAEARWLAASGKRAEAIEKAKDATRVEPTNADARALLQQLTSSKRPPPKPTAMNRDDDMETP